MTTLGPEGAEKFGILKAVYFLWITQTHNDRMAFLGFELGSTAHSSQN